MPYSDKDEEIALRRGFNPVQLRQIQLQKGLTNRELADVSEKQIRSLLRGLDVPDRPHARQAFLRLTQLDERGVVEPNVLARAIEQLNVFRMQTTKLRIAGIPGGVAVAARMIAPTLQPAAGISSPTQWKAIGPGNIGGRTRSVVIHPILHDTIWIGSVGGGVWRTDDGGQDWNPVDDRMANLAVSCMAMDPTDANIIYAGTGEGFDNVDAIRGSGIFRTTDGVNWSSITSTVNQDFFWINRLAISIDGVVLLAATLAGMFRSDDPGRTTWKPVLSGVQLTDVRFHPTDPRQAVAGAKSGNAYFTTDGGKTWAKALSARVWSGRVELAYAVQNPKIVYASIQMDTGEVWRSIDGGQSYQRRNSLSPDGIPANYLGSQGWYDNTIWAGDPQNADFVIVGGIDLWKSTDGGNTLRKISNWREPTSVHADHHAIVAHPHFGQGGNRTVFFGNDGGIYRADDIVAAGDPDLAQGWTHLINGYDVTQFYGGAGNVTTGTIIGGAQDNGTLSFNPATGANAWTDFFGGDGGFVAAHPNNANLYFGEYVYMEVFRNDNAATDPDKWWEKYITGRFFNPTTGNWDWKPLPFTVPEVRNQKALFIAPFILDPNEPNRLLGGALSLWRTNDAATPNTNSSGPSWESIKPANLGAHISAIAVAHGKSDLIWIGYENGQIFRTDNGTANSPVWERIDNTGPDSLSVGRYCTRIVIDPVEHSTIYAMFGGFSKTNLWKTIDSASTWQVLSNALPEAPIRALAIHPGNRDFLYVGTEVGIFSSEDGGGSWSPTNEGPTNCAVYDLFWMGETLVCVTHGRGMFTIDLSHV